MDKRQKAILAKFISIIIITIISIVAMINVKSWINHSEAMRAIEHLSQIIIQYKEDYGSVPSETYIHDIKEKLRGYPRLGTLHYRALWIDLESTPDEILAYAEQNYNSWFVKDGFLLIRLDGRVEWMNKQEFKTTLAEQQTQAEVQALKLIK